MIEDESKPLDVRLDSASREGLTGRAQGDSYVPRRDEDEISRAPDGRAMETQPAWRKDFPIDWPEDDYVSRRDFAKFMTLISLAFAAGQAWIVGRSWWQSSERQLPVRKVASLGEIAIGQSLVFHYPGESNPCVLVRLGESELVAFGQKCTHLSCAVIPHPEEGVFRCPCHEGFFDLRSGRNLSGPPPRPLPRVALELRGDDVYATGIEEGVG